MKTKDKKNINTKIVNKYLEKNQSVITLSTKKYSNKKIIKVKKNNLLTAAIAHCIFISGANIFIHF